MNRQQLGIGVLDVRAHAAKNTDTTLLGRSDALPKEIAAIQILALVKERNRSWIKRDRP